MFTLEQKVDLILRYIATVDEVQREELKKRVIGALNSEEMTISATPNVDDLIFNMLKVLGMPRHLRGYKYVVTAIKLCIQNPSYMDNITCRLYPKIASEYNTTWRRVERCIRSAVEYVFYNGDLDEIATVFGNTVPPHRGKLTNREFIVSFADEISRRMKGT